MSKRPEFYYDGRYYRKRIKMPEGTWKDVRAKTKEELRSKLYDIETHIRKGIILDDHTTVAELAVEWYTNRKAGLSVSRQTDYRTAINSHIAPVIGNLELRELKPEHCMRVMAACADLSYSAQQKIVSTLKQLCDCAVENGLIYKSPAAKLKPGGAKPEEKQALTREQCTALEAAVKGTRAYLFVMLGLYAGLRREEICGLTWSDVDLEADPPRLTVNHAIRFAGGRAEYPAPLKTRAAHRTIPIPPPLADALKAERGKTNSFFVVHGQDGQHVTYQSMRNLIGIIDRRCPPTAGAKAKRAREEQERGKPYQKRADMVPKLDFRPTPHQLRHTYITRLIEAGLDVKRVQYLAGHEDIRMTLNVYSHVMNNRPEDIIDQISAAFAQPPAATDGQKAAEVLPFPGAKQA